MAYRYPSPRVILKEESAPLAGNMTRVCCALAPRAAESGYIIYGLSDEGLPLRNSKGETTGGLTRRGLQKGEWDPPLRAATSRTRNTKSDVIRMEILEDLD